MKEIRYQFHIASRRGGGWRNLLVTLMCLVALPLFMLVGLSFWFAALVLAFAAVAITVFVALLRRVLARAPPRR